jgi:hypothetical protein
MRAIALFLLQENQTDKKAADAGGVAPWNQNWTRRFPPLRRARQHPSFLARRSDGLANKIIA